MANFNAGAVSGGLASTSTLLTFPHEVLVTVFEATPLYFRCNLARTSKMLANIAKERHLLMGDPRKDTLLQHLLPEPGTAATSLHYPMRNLRINLSRCNRCSWEGVSCSQDWFKHVSKEATRLNVYLSKGMMRELGFEAIRDQVTRPDTFFAALNRSDGGAVAIFGQNDEFRWLLRECLRIWNIQFGDVLTYTS